jgi:hypothetical protein
MKSDDYQEFLLAVVNGADISKSEGVRRKFASLYRNWFSEDADEGDIEELRWEYHEFHSYLWKAKHTETPKEVLATPFGARVALLRQQLRVIWEVATWGEREEAEYQSRRLCNGPWWSGDRADRLVRTYEWLHKNVARIRICGNPECGESVKYFFRRWNNHKYCSLSCNQRAHEIRRLQHQQERPPKPFTRPPEARIRMSQSAKKRWKKDKDKKGK